MASIQTLAESHEDIINTNSKGDVETWFMVESPTPVFTIVGTYLFFILKLGPQMMANRKPYNLQTLLIAYNCVLVFMSLFLSLLPFTLGMTEHVFKEGCRPSQGLHNDLSKSMDTFAWWYLVTKIVELLDTVFFVLRKKQRQITFLHVYHHSSLVLYTWWYLKYMTGPQVVVVGFLNSFVHIIMYFYYMVAAMGPQYQKYIWWKKYMTGIQMTQFVLMLTYLISLFVRDCQLPRLLITVMVINVIFFLGLFINFYVKTYKKKNKTE